LNSQSLLFLDTTTLSGHLWEAANILRGSVDAADFKTYISPLIGKRIVILHEFIKKTAKTSIKELGIAQSHLAEVKRNDPR